MKASFTHYLKIKWRHLLPLLCFGMMAVQTAYADCSPDLKGATLTLTCDGELSLTIPGFPNVKMSAEAVDTDGNPTGWPTSFLDLPRPHAIGTWAPGSLFSLEVTCEDNSVANIHEPGALPAWDIKAGTGAGEYSWTGTGWKLDKAFTNGGSLSLSVVNKEDPWCPDSHDGKIWVRLDGDVTDKCDGATYRINLNGGGYSASMDAAALVAAPLGQTKFAKIGETVLFDGLWRGDHTFTAEVDMYSCPCGITINPSTVTATLVQRTGTTTSMACVAQVNLSLSSACKATLTVDDVLLGINDPCMVSMVDSLIVKDPADPSGPPLATGSGVSMGLVTIDNADEFLGKNLIVEIYSSNLGNHCWGNVLIEDKSAPIVTCEDETLMRIRCLEYDGTPERTIAGLVHDCSDFDVTIIAENLLDRCNDLTDSVLRKVIVTYSARDIHGNQSNTCTDTLEVLRFDPIAGNGILDCPGKIIMPPNFVLDPQAGMLVNGQGNMTTERDPLRCVRAPLESYVREYAGSNEVEPAPIAIGTANTIGGTGFPVLQWTDSDGNPRTSPLHALNYKEANQAYQEVVDGHLKNCSIGVQYEDLTFRFGCKIKIQRQWYLYEWSCEGEQRKNLGVQEIVVMDFEDPEFSEIVPDETFSVGAYQCSRILDIKYPTVTDNCDDDVDIQAAIYDADWNLIGPTINPISGVTNTTFDYPFGWNYVVYTATDDCDNFVRDTARVHIIDETPPVVICKEYLVVGLSTDGTVRVPESAFNNGTYDDCGLESTCVVRMDDLQLLEDLDTDNDGEVLWSTFNAAAIACGRDYSAYTYVKEDGKRYISSTTICTPFVEFCCADNITDTSADEDGVMVVFRATDNNGNVNNCMVFVELQDKQVPEITCLPDVWIDCDFVLPDFESSYDDMSDDPLSALFGDVVAQNDQKAFGIASAELKHNILEDSTDISTLVDAVYYDNCNAPTIPVTIESDIDNCGFGYIKRTYYATDGDNRSKTCVQWIRIFRQAFDEAVIKDPEEFVYLEGCMIPEDLVKESFGEPEVIGDNCSLIGISQENQIFTFNTADQESDACFKIIRKFTIIDWCQSTANDPVKEIYHFTQVIKVNDPDGPEITCADDIEITTSDCEEESVMFMATADDECTNGTDLLWTGRLEILDDEGEVVEFRALTELLIVDGEDGKATYLATLPIGKHRLIWSVTDRCGNTSACTQYATITNNKKPTPFAINVSTALMNTNGMVEIWAEDFNQKSTHPCYDDALIQFAISPQGAGFAAATANMTFDCNSAVINYLDFYAFIEIDGDVIYDFTTVELKVKDTNDFCSNDRPDVSGTNTSALITGNIRTSDDANVPNIAVDLFGGNQGASALEGVMTDVQGEYAFPAMTMGGHYIVEPSSTDDYLNGVTTLDLVLIQRYVLGIYDIESPYKLIAADINKDNGITALDLVELRSVILGFETEFPNNESWRFVDATYEFLDPANPLDENFSERHTISDLSASMNVDFVGLKVGDINGSIDAASVIAKSRSTHTLVANDVSFVGGESVAMPITSGQNILASGTQFTLEFDADKLSFVGIEAGALSISAEHLGTHRLANGALSVSWSDVQDVTIDKGDILFTALFEAKSTSTLAQTVQIGSSLASAEIYDASYETSGLSLSFEDNKVESGFALFQNSPNPFADQTRIAFYLPRASAATLTIHDVTGKVVRSYKGSFDKGNNYISVNNGELSGTGVMYYTLATDEYTDTKRMVVLK